MRNTIQNNSLVLNTKLHNNNANKPLLRELPERPLALTSSQQDLITFAFPVASPFASERPDPASSDRCYVNRVGIPLPPSNDPNSRGMSRRDGAITTATPLMFPTTGAGGVEDAYETGGCSDRDDHVLTTE